MYGTQLLGHLGDHAVNLLPASDVGHEREDAPVGLAAQLAGSCLQISIVPRNDRRPLLGPTLVRWLCRYLDFTMARLPCNPRSMAVSHLVGAPVFRSNHHALFSHQDRGASAMPVGKITGATYRDGQNRRAT
jgi:hypothetical protein